MKFRAGFDFDLLLVTALPTKCCARTGTPAEGSLENPRRGLSRTGAVRSLHWRTSLFISAVFLLESNAQPAWLRRFSWVRESRILRSLGPAAAGKDKWGHMDTKRVQYTRTELPSGL